ncbi:HAD family hydrolase [Romeria aff. gracilis LEGE 07310]|uniref:HAD family hydrolase n=1 Tax=Vasconcelosia minhoensis LEGE 07310 TaxID=915328 RepID=A0A8J7DDY9_9CYAN|nr:HAD family hydrolase [Romeria gracilis]MBE9079298.1 HAD family hydrolase [Romeria aff. gracilis LEGE 07310]
MQQPTGAGFQPVSPISLVDHPGTQANSARTSASSVVFCDFDGPIVDVSERYYRTYQTGLRAVQTKGSGPPLRVQALPKEQFWRMKRSRVEDGEIAVRSGLPESIVETFLQQVTRMVNHAHLLQWDRPQPTARASLALLKRHQVRLVLVTLRHPRQVEDFLSAHGLAAYVSEVYGVSDIMAAHANRVAQKVDLLKHAISQQSEFSTAAAWMIGDTEADIIAGQQAGLSTAALTCGTRSRSHLQTLHPTALHETLLAAVQAIIHQAQVKAA